MWVTWHVMTAEANRSDILKQCAVPVEADTSYTLNVKGLQAEISRSGQSWQQNCKKSEQHITIAAKGDKP